MVRERANACLSISDSRPQCTNPNTVLSPAKRCVCRSGFPYGSPNLSTGCFACESDCHTNGHCEYPGTCVCNPLYAGDGVATCTRIIPEILSITPSSGPQAGGTLVTMHYEYSYTNMINMTKGYCRFGKYYVFGTILPNSTIQCATPPSPPVSQFVSISFDGVGWSESPKFFHFEWGGFPTRPVKVRSLRPLARCGILIAVTCIITPVWRQRK
jgi:hypothetical protein